MRAMRAGRMMGVAALMALAGCDGATDPPYATGTVSFEYQGGGDPAPVTWTATGACGSENFVLGSATCAVGSEERQYVAAMGVLRATEGGFGTATVVHPTADGTPCEASASASVGCGMEFIPVRDDFSEEPSPFWLLTSGTVTAGEVEVDGVTRLTGTFEGTATDPNGAGEPLVITNGTFDVELVR